MGRRTLALVFTSCAVGSKVVNFIIYPLWLDCFKSPDNSTNQNDSQGDVNGSNTRQIDPYFGVMIQSLSATLLFGCCLLVIIIGFPTYVTSVERKYPRKYFVLTGAANGISATMCNYALSGTRTAPYLIALLGNFLVPLQFIVRLFILHKWPTRRKLLCAVAVVVAEFVCLIPKIFPGLDTHHEKQHDGGSSGIAGVLWPLSFVIALIPGTMNNAWMERTVQSKSTDDVRSTSNQNQLNMIYYLFWFSLCYFITGVATFWLDIIPGYGTANGIINFFERMEFNISCFFGGAGCGVYVVALGWATLLVNLLALFANAYLLRYTEGANFMMIAMTLRSPVIFLFWTLFQERPFMWDPYLSLTTWLSIGALCVMIPSVFIYNTGPPEKHVETLWICCARKSLPIDDINYTFDESEEELLAESQTSE